MGVLLGIFDWLVSVGLAVGAFYCARWAYRNYQEHLVNEPGNRFNGYIVFNRGEDTWLSGFLGFCSVLCTVLFLVSLIGKIPAIPFNVEITAMGLSVIAVILFYFTGENKVLQLISSDPLESAVVFFLKRRERIIYHQGLVFLPLPLGIMSLKKFNVTDQIFRVVGRSTEQGVVATVTEQTSEQEMAHQQAEKLVDNIVPEMKPILTNDGVRVAVEVGFVYRVINPYNALNIDQLVLKQTLPHIFLEALRDTVAEHDADWVRSNRNQLQRAIQNLFEEQQIDENGNVITDQQGRPVPGELVDSESRYGIEVVRAFVGDVSFDKEVEDDLQKRYRELKQIEAERAEQEFIAEEISKHKRRGLTAKEAADLLKIERGKATETIFNIPGLKEGLISIGEGIGKLGKKDEEGGAEE